MSGSDVAANVAEAGASRTDTAAGGGGCVGKEGR